MRLLILADAGAPTGFATVTENIGRRLVTDYGWDVSVLAANWRGDHVDSPMKFYLPTQLIPADLYGRSRFVELLAKIMPDAILMVNDPAVLMDHFFANDYDPQRVLWQGIQMGEVTYRPPIIAYMPIDGYDSPRSWDILKERVTRVAMSKFGRDTAMPEAPVVWHGVDRSVFKPMDKKEAKKALGFDPDRFLIVRTDKNSIRKDYPALWKALRPLLRKYGDIDVHFHCLPRAGDGYNLNAIRYNDEDIRDRVGYTQDLGGYSGPSAEQLAVLYSAADLYVSTSWGEGFGLTLLEAMACGTPVIAQNCSAITEVVGPGGVLIEPASRISTPMGQDQCLPDIAGFTKAIEHLYEAGGVRRKLGRAAVEHARQFSWQYAAEAIDRQIVAAVEESHAVPVGVGPSGGDPGEVRPV